MSINVKITHFIFIVTLFVVITSCDRTKGQINHITTTALKGLLKKDKEIQLVDVRTPEEWEAGIIKGAQKIEVTSSTFTNKAMGILQKDKPVYLYCRKGGRSSRAAKILQEKGFEVYSVEGGYTAWKKTKE